MVRALLARSDGGDSTVSVHQYLNWLSTNDSYCFLKKMPAAPSVMTPAAPVMPVVAAQLAMAPSTKRREKKASNVQLPPPAPPARDSGR